MRYVGAQRDHIVRRWRETRSATTMRRRDGVEVTEGAASCDLCTERLRAGVLELREHVCRCLSVLRARIRSVKSVETAADFCQF